MTKPKYKPAPPNMLTVQDVAARFGVSKMTVYRLIEAEELLAYRVGRSIRIDPADLAEFIEGAATIAQIRGGAA